MPQVKVKEVNLSGFGPHRGTVKYIFTDRLNVWVAPNESGKSTMVAGIGAIIFGIPQTTDVTVFGQARYRNWDHPAQFTGELIYEVEQVTYRIRRDFDSNHVSLAQLTGDQYHELAGGTHNPRAQRRNQHYEEMIKTLFGLSSQELFDATFCLTQPLPEKEEIDEQVQGLLSGSGTGFNRVIGKLTEELRTITRFTGRRGVTSKDALAPRALEILEEEIVRIKQAIANDREVVDRLETIRRQLQEQEMVRKEEKEACDEKERMLTQWAEWKRLRESYYAAQKFYSQVKKAKEQARKLADELKQVDQEKQSFPWGPSLPVETGDLITELQSLQEQKARLLRQIRELESQVSTIIEVDRLQAEEGESDRMDWGVFGPRPVSVLKGLQRQTEEALADWANLQQTQAAYRECQTTMEEEFALFYKADQATIEALKSYNDRKVRLFSVLESAALKLEKAKAELKKVNRRRKYRMVLSLLMGVITGGATAWWLGGKWGLPVRVLMVLSGAGVGYLLSRLFFPTGSLGLLRDKVTENEQSVAQAQQESKDFEQMVKPFELHFADLPGACRRWEQFQAQREELSAKIQEFSRRELGSFSGAAEHCPLEEAGSKIAKRWAELQDLAQATEGRVSFNLLGDLINWLQDRTPQWWDQLLTKAEDYEAKVQAVMETKVKNQANKAYLEKQRGALADLEVGEQTIASRITGLLDAANGDFAQARSLWLSWRNLELKTEKISEALHSILSTQEVAFLEELEGKSDDASLRAQAVYNEWQKLIVDHPGLTGIDDATNPQKIEDDFRRLQQEVKRGQAVLSGIDQEIGRLTKELARAEGQEPVNIAVAESQLQEMEERRGELMILGDALTLAYQELTAAINDFQSSYRLRLAEIVSQYYQNLTGCVKRTVEITEEFRVMINEDGRPVVPAQLSHGARDQLYIALRLGIARLLAEETVLPFIFDDPFLNCDEERLGNIRYSLAQLATERQILLLSHRDDFLPWGEKVQVVKI